MSPVPATSSFEAVREALERWLAFVYGACEQPGVTDLALYSDGAVAIRANTFLKCVQQPWLAQDWDRATAAALGTPPWREQPTNLKASLRVITIRERRFRCTWSLCERGESVAVRPLPTEIRTPEQLRLPSILAQSFASLSGGLVLIGGPTGSGKSWTLASLLRHRAQFRGGRFVTLEKPIEFLHASSERSVFDQREVGRHVSTYATGLEEAVVQNPDVISVQELRDKRSAETALAGALSGHVMVATMHAYDAPSTPMRFVSLLELGHEATAGALYSLSLCLELIVVLRLIPGHEGLVPVFDLLTMRDRPGGMRSNRMAQSIARGNAQAMRAEMQAGRAAGMITFEESIQERRAEGLILE